MDRIETELTENTPCMYSHHSSHTYDSGNIPEDGEERLQELDHQKVYSEAISLTRGNINKTGTMPISMGILTGMGKICRVPPLAKELQATNGCRGRRISPFQG